MLIVLVLFSISWVLVPLSVCTRYLGKQYLLSNMLKLDARASEPDISLVVVLVIANADEVYGRTAECGPLLPVPTLTFACTFLWVILIRLDPHPYLSTSRVISCT